ncbi:MAG: alpha/beta hydrolase family protein [Acidobacteriota bacterium]
MHRAYVDASRTNWAGDGLRPLATTVWYPASAESVESAWTAGVFEFGSGAEDASFADVQAHPLIVMSHGTGGSAAQLSWLAEELVAAGFVVAAVNHHGNTAVEDKAWPQGFVLPGERARDLAVLIDQLLADPELSAHIDSTRIGAAGFSLGGYTVLVNAGAQLTFVERQQKCKIQLNNPVCHLPPEAGFSDADIQALAESDPVFQKSMKQEGQPAADARIRAVYAIAPAFLSLMDSQNLSSVHIPLRVTLAEADQQILLAQTLEAIHTGLPKASVSRIPDAGHYVFLARCSLRGRIFLADLCKDASEVDRIAVHKQVGTDAANFFKANL